MLTSGTQLGPYDIVEPLGAGGMGEVYRARDHRLGREVALKVLPQDHSEDPERLRRFEREARAVASLNHPHILALYDIGTHDATTYVVFELLEGQTLRAILLEHGALPPRKVADYGVQICRGLATAHAHGIVHRDLKPENLFLTRDGQIKILDFGLARVSGSPEEPESHDSQSPTATEPGLIVGTASYMSPEQARGRPADDRSDLFALGAVLFEMLSGRRAFSGETAADTLSAILHHDPPDLPTRADSAVTGLEHVARRCLEKRPEDRFDSAHDLGLALEMLSGPMPSGPGLRHLRSSWRWVAAGLAAVVLAVGGWLLWSQATEAPTPPIRITPFTTDAGLKERPRLSPDGEKVAYAWTGADDDNWDIYVKGLGLGAAPLRLTEHPADDRSPAWSPDERQIAFLRRPAEGLAAIYTVPSLGGRERRLVNVGHPVHAWHQSGLSWSPDGEWLVFAEQRSPDDPARIVRVSLATLEKQTLTTPPAGTEGDLGLAISPDGSQLAFVRSASRDWGDHDLWVQPWEGGEPRRLTFARYDDCRSPVWTPDGAEIVFTAMVPSRVFRVSVAGGQTRPIAGIGENASNASIRGNRMVYEQLAVVQGDIWRVPGRTASVSDREPEKLIASSRHDFNPSYSPDGRRIAFASNRTRTANIWMCDHDGANLVQLTDFERWTSTPRWSPDGRRLVFDSLEGESSDLYVVDVDGGLPRRLTREGSSDTTGSWSRDGTSIYFGSDRSGEIQIWRMPSAGGPAIQVTRGGGIYAEESWDGRHLYYARPEAHGTGLWRIPVGGGEEVEVVPDGHRNWTDWALSREGIYYATKTPRGRGEGYAIEFLELESGHVTELFRREGPFIHDWLAVSPDERWILYKEEPAPQSELMLVESFR